MIFKSKYTQEILDYLTMTAGVMAYAFTLAFCILPYKLTSGGVAGIGTLVFYSTGLEVQNTVFVINALLLVAAVKELGWRFCIKTIYATLGLTLSIWFAQRVYEMVGRPMIVGDELFMACIMSALGSGFGLSLCFMAGGSTGGTDIVAAIVNKYRNISLGKVIMLVDIAIISSCYLVFHDIRRVVFGYVLLIVASLTLDYLLSRSHQSVEFKIYSRNPYPIAEAITKNGWGVTVLDGMGYYTRSERKVLVSVVTRSERPLMFRLIRSIDPYAFVTMGNVSGVYGEGFDAIENGGKQKGHTPRVVVMLTDSAQQLDDARHQLGDAYEVRTLSDIGCNIEHPLHPDILSSDPLIRARAVKYYYGYDCLVVDPDTRQLSVVTGKAATDNLQVCSYAEYCKGKQ